MLKLAVIGLDGASWNLLKPLMDSGIMPTLRELYAKGSRAVLESTIPPMTYLGWKSYSTGKNPGKYGVFYWFKLSEIRSGRLVPHDSRSYKSMEIWDYLGEAGYRCGVIGMPMTYPPKRINGFMVSGILATHNSEYTCPPELKEELERKYNYRILPSMSFRIRPGTSPGEAINRWLLAVEEATCLTEKTFSIAIELAQRESLDFLHTTIFFTDQMSHCMWKPLYCTDRLRETVQNFWTTLDREIERFTNFLGRHTPMFLMSDHGMSPTKATFHVNSWLETKNLLKLKKAILPEVLYKFGITKEKARSLYFSRVGCLAKILQKTLRGRGEKGMQGLWFRLRSKSGDLTTDELWQYIDWRNTKVVMLGDGHMKINVDKGSLEYERLRQDLTTMLLSIRNPTSGESIFEVNPPDRLYRGEYTDDFDLLLSPKEGYSILGSYVENGEIWSFGSLDGMTANHDRHGVFLAWGPGIKENFNAEVIKMYDLAPTILHMFGVRMSRDVDGRVLKEIFKEDSELCYREVQYREDIKERVERKVRALRLKRLP